MKAEFFTFCLQISLEIPRNLREVCDQKPKVFFWIFIFLLILFLRRRCCQVLAAFMATSDFEIAKNISKPLFSLLYIFEMNKDYLNEILDTNQKTEWGFEKRFLSKPRVCPLYVLHVAIVRTFPKSQPTYQTYQNNFFQC